MFISQNLWTNFCSQAGRPNSWRPSSKYPFAINARDIKSCVSRFNFTQICVINYYLQNLKKISTYRREQNFTHPINKILP